MSNFDPYHLLRFWNPFHVLDMCKLVFVYKIIWKFSNLLKWKFLDMTKIYGRQCSKYPTPAKLWIISFLSKIKSWHFTNVHLRINHMKRRIDNDKITQFWDNPNREIWLTKFKYLGLWKVWLVLLSMCSPINFTFLYQLFWFKLFIRFWVLFILYNIFSILNLSACCSVSLCIIWNWKYEDNGEVGVRSWLHRCESQFRNYVLRNFTGSSP